MTDHDRVLPSSWAPPAAAVYVLVHPERWITNELDVLYPTGHCEESGTSDPEPGWQQIDLRRLDEAHGLEVTRVAHRCARRIVIDDGSIADDLAAFDDPEMFPGCTADGWELVNAEPRDLSRLGTLLPAGTDVVLAGFARHDCVAVVQQTLEAAGCRVHRHEQAILPVTDPGWDWWRTRSAAARP